MRQQGKIVSWNEKKGFGFVKPTNGGKEVFIHIKEFDWKPEIGQTISFSMGTDNHGRVCGKIAIPSGSYLTSEKSHPTAVFSYLLAFLSLASIAVFVSFTNNHYLISVAYVFMSLITFFFYWLDKSAAKKGSWRTPENTLHLLAISGGWPGALIAQQKLRHKTRKQPFQTIFWLTVLANMGGLYWILSNNIF